MLNMFRRNRSSAAVAVMEPVEEQTVTVPAVTVPTRVRPQPVIGGAELAKYVALAEKAKFAPPELLQHRLTQFFMDNQIEIYPYNSVVRYLDHKFGAPRKISKYPYFQPGWSWHPLRVEDDGKLITPIVRSTQNGYIEKGRTYRKIIPAPVLETVDLIASHFAGSTPSLHFYVSDVAVPHKELDPFLAISAVGINFIVVERWDEPAFRR